MRSKPIYGLEKLFFHYFFYITIFVYSICYFTRALIKESVRDILNYIDKEKQANKQKTTV